MNFDIKEIQDIINKTDELPDDVKTLIEKHLKKLDRQLIMDEFKIKKLDGTLKTMFYLLNQNIKDVENKSTEIKLQNEIIKQQKLDVETKQKEILDSITYSKRIQKTILPPSNFFDEYTRNSFILYKPKDIVAGDFYWAEKTGDKLLFAVCDCTGHGVPGALVSVVCFNALNRTVRELKITQPSKILDKTSEIIEDSFSTFEEKISDGMDISLCAFNLKTHTLEWSGANNPIWIINNSLITELKPDKQPIGKFENKKSFTNHVVSLKKGDTIYLFTDGIQDQFGGEKGKKFKAANLKQLLLSIEAEPLEKQKGIINNEFERWKGNLEQVDDVCILGIQLIR